MVEISPIYIRGFRKGYALAARTANRSPASLLFSWLVSLLLTWPVAVLLLWFAVDISSRNVAGEPVTKAVMDRYKASNTVHSRPEKASKTACRPP